jgi:hypothetical protein
MKIRKFGRAFALPAAGAVLLLTGCFSLSVNPLHDGLSTVYEPQLVGLWGAPDDPQGESWEFQAGPDRSYRLLVRAGDNLRLDPATDAAFTAHLVRLEDHLFLDLFPEEPEQGSDFYKSHIVPAHSIWRVKLEGHTLTLWPMDAGKLMDSLQDGSLAVDHVERDGVLVFTAPTVEMQSLVATYRDSLFTDGETLQRLQ